ncbi:MAG TPA: hypothetical protein VEV62_19395 [Parafilimonas sp.]|nr:hypothetical protein [Parafilimonas sp.]
MRKKRLVLSVIIFLVLAISAFVVIHYSSLRSIKNKTALSKQTSPIDLRPAIIAKLQSLVKTGSDGLYDLSIQKIEPDILSSTVSVFGAKLIPNAQALKLLDSLKKAPDDIFTISLDSLHITGINVDDLLHTSDIQLDSIIISKPVIVCDHQPKEYNRLQHEREERKTLYQKLMGQLKSVNIQSILIQKCIYTSKQKNKRQKIFNEITMQFKNLRIDSSTQFDKQRLFFSKQVNISCNNFLSRTTDSLYMFKIDSIQINATEHSLIANNVALIPRGSKTEFEKKLKYQDNRFTLFFPKVIAKNIDWWALTNNESFTSDEMELYNPVIKDYVDRSLPTSDKNNNIKDFPHQLLMKVPLKINVKNLQLHKFNLSYEEFNSQSNKTGTVTFNNINGTITNISNMPAVMKTYQYTTAKLNGFFMNAVPLTSNFSFDLKKYKTGNFSMQMNIESIDKNILNPIAEPLGLFTIKTGTVTKANTKIEGDNFTSNVDLLMLYNDLHLTPLKKDSGGTTTMHKKTITSFFANVFLIKDANPSHGNVRNVQVNAQRNIQESFFGFVWKSILTAILKTIGIPEKYAGKR